jgi:hypothetical protein
MQEKLRYKYHIMFWTNIAALCTTSELRFVLHVKWNKKVKGYNKTKSCKPFWNAKCYEMYLLSTQLPKTYATAQNKNETNMTTTLPLNMTNCILTATVYHNTQDFHIFIGEQIVLNFKINLNDITFKSHTHTHTHTSDKIFTVKSTKDVTTINIPNIT